MIPEKQRGETKKPYLFISPKNKREAIVAEDYYSKGWIVLKNGWPDLFCYNKETGEIELVEVKAKSQLKITKSGYRKLGRSQEQLRMHQYLEKAGFKVKIIHVD